MDLRTGHVAGRFVVRFSKALGKKDISVIKTGSKKISVFEGFQDFLRFLTHLGKEKTDTDNVVLNSVALKSQVLEFIRGKGYEKVFTYFDNDKAGVTALKSLREGV